MEGDDRRFVAEPRITVAEHFALEARALRPLPEPFDYAALDRFRVDRMAPDRRWNLFWASLDTVLSTVDKRDLPAYAAWETDRA